jgi:hypothetical protein
MSTRGFVVYGSAHDRARMLVRAAVIGAFVLAVLIAAVSVLRAAGSGGGAAASHAVARPAAAAHTAHATAHAASKPKAPPAATTHVRHHHAAPPPPPAKTPVMVLNSNGVSGSAATMASRLRSLGYPTPVVTNAAHQGLPTTIEFRPGFGTAAQFLAHKIGGVHYVVPLDGLHPDQLHGAALVLFIGR